MKRMAVIGRGLHPCPMRRYGEPSLWRELWAWLKQAQDGVNSIEDRWGPDAAERFGQ